MKYINLLKEKAKIWYETLTLKQKLMYGFGLIIGLMVLISIIPFFMLGGIKKNTASFADVHIPMLEYANEMQTSVVDAALYFQTFSARGDTAILSRGKKSFSNAQENAQKLNELVRDFDVDKELKITFENALSLLNTLGEKYAIANNVGAERGKFLGGMASMRAEYEQLLSAIRDQQDVVAEKNIQGGNTREALLAHRRGMLAVKALNIMQKSISNEVVKDSVLLRNYIATLDTIMENLREISPEGKVAGQVQAAIDVRTKYLVASKKFMSDFGKVMQVTQEIPVVASQLQKESKNLTRRIETVSGDSASSINLKIIFSRLIIFIGIVIAVFVSLAIAKSILKQTYEPLLEGIEKATKLSTGDLTTKFVRTDNKDEIGKLTNAMANMTDNLTIIVKSIISSANQISTSSGDIKTASQQMSTSANEQAASAEEVSSSIEEMSSSIQQNSDNAKETEKITNSNTAMIHDCSKAAERSIEVMDEISDKISIIDDIAFQTNILALNAAVEAARAGEHGKGFAVVAADIGKLAERCAVAAKEIDQVCKEGVNVAETTNNVFEKLLPEIERSTILVQEIAASCSEQASGSEQINTAVQRFNISTQQFASISNEMAAGADKLSKQASKLTGVVRFFKLAK